MLPNWIYYLIGKKSGGGSPTPTKPKVLDGLQLFYGARPSYQQNIIFSEQELQNFIDSLDFSDVTLWNNYFYNWGSSAGLDYTVHLDNIHLNKKIRGSLDYFLNNVAGIKNFYLWGSFDTTEVTNFKNMFAYCNALTNIYGIEKLNYSGVKNGYNTNIQDLIKNDSNLSNETLLKFAHSLLTVPDYYTNKTLRHVGYSSTQATYVVNNSTDWTTLETLGWTTGY